MLKTHPELMTSSVGFTGIREANTEPPPLTSATGWRLITLLRFWPTCRHRIQKRLFIDHDKRKFKP